jgi:hypothetical protein
LIEGDFLHLAIGAVITAIHLAAFLFAFQADDRRLDPLVLRQLLGALANRLLEGRDRIRLPRLDARNQGDHGDCERRTNDLFTFHGDYL